MQIPAERLGERATPGRDRSIRDLAYHVYQVPDAFLQAVEDGVEDLTSVYNAPPPAERETSHGHPGLRPTASRQACSAGGPPCPTSPAARTSRPTTAAAPAPPAGALHLALGAARAPDHLRVLERFGIPADGPLTRPRTMRACRCRQASGNEMNCQETDHAQPDRALRDSRRRRRRAPRRSTRTCVRLEDQANAHARRRSSSTTGSPRATKASRHQRRPDEAQHARPAVRESTWP
jgi:hypothetical protein